MINRIIIAETVEKSNCFPGAERGMIEKKREREADSLRYKAALVDFDGTLVDSMHAWMDLPWEAFRRAGQEPPEELDAMLRAAPILEVARKLSAAYPMLSPDRPLVEYWLEIMEENYLRRVPLKPGADALLELLRQMGLRIVILSATSQPLLGRALDHFDLTGRADAVITEAEAGSKRTPAPYDRCAALLGLAREDMLLIEDAPRNLAAARALGLGTVGVPDESLAAERPLLLASADVVLPDYADLRPLELFLAGKAGKNF